VMTVPPGRDKRGRKLVAIAVGVILIVAIGASVFIFSSRPDLTVSLNKSSLQIQRGTIQTLTVSISTKNSASGQVSLSASGLPTNVTASFSNQAPQIQAGGSTESNLTITAGPHAYGQNSTLTITASVNGLTRQTSLLIAVVGNTYNYDIGGSYAGGWNVTTINAVEGDVIVLHLTSSDSSTHAFFVDYNGNAMPDQSEPLSPNFNSPTVSITFSFMITQVGIFTYYCKYHPNMTGTLHSATP
jgi:heme/copper-type cytochrome/quinol oxidase subunit 2